MVRYRLRAEWTYRFREVLTGFCTGKLPDILMLRMEHIAASGDGTWDTAFEPHRSNYYQILMSKLIVRAMFVAPTSQVSP